jgi:hypothetical protein
MIEWFWLIFVSGTLLWFAAVTGIVAIKGYRDIREMLVRLASDDPGDGSIPKI